MKKHVLRKLLEERDLEPSLSMHTNKSSAPINVIKHKKHKKNKKGGKWWKR